ESPRYYAAFAKIVPRLKEGPDYNIDEKLRAVSVTEEGINKVEQILGVQNIYEEKGFRYVHYLEQALKAQALFKLDRDYVVKNGEVIIVDEFTGRLMPGRRYSEGLHQALEAKEGVAVQQESRTLASITFQNYFRMYGKIAGMTGTALTSAEEFHKVYKLDVVPVPTNKPLIRKNESDLIYKTDGEKWRAVVKEIKERNEKGQPVLVGTVSIEKNEKLAAYLKREGIPFNLLNAKNHEQEAEIIAQAGKLGAVTIATNMAGRGVDIILGGNPPSAGEASKVRESGGLYVIGTERHEARRIDNQLRGRSGRQGDPGSSRFFISLEDDLLRVFGGDKIKRMMETFGLPEDTPIEHKIIAKGIEAAQAKIEGFHFDARKHVLEYDEILNKQRLRIYKTRRDVLEKENENKERILKMFDEEIRRIVEFHSASDDSFNWNTEEICEAVKALAPFPDVCHSRLLDVKAEEKDPLEKRGNIVEYLESELKKIYDAREKEVGGENSRQIEKIVLLRTIDMLWMDHLDAMEHLRDSVRLRAYGQRDPLVEYKNEGYKMFRQLLASINQRVAGAIFKVEITKQPAPTFHQAPSVGGERPETTGRNDPCPCGSGKKYKKCHGK
ncbi:MAG: SEC-C metal-binding domain-containing protein, partial [Patescibacteria group bacterium]